MRLGANGMNEDQIARKLADVGANMNPTFDVDRAGYSLRTLSSEAEQQQALQVLARVLQAPAFPEPVLEREKARVVAGLKESDTKSESIAARAFMTMVFGDHPYGRRAAGESDTVAKLSRSDVLGFYQSHYNPDRAVVAIMVT
jgi:zinc protease